MSTLWLWQVTDEVTYANRLAHTQAEALGDVTSTESLSFRKQGWVSKQEAAHCVPQLPQALPDPSWENLNDRPFPACVLETQP